MPDTGGAIAGSTGRPNPDFLFPDEVRELYRLAHDCVREYEKLPPGRRDTKRMNAWRDTLDHCVFSRRETVPAARLANGRLATEHLARMALDAAQSIAIHELKCAERRESQRWWRNLYLAYPNGAQVREQLDAISWLIVEGRELKGGGSPERWIHGVGKFLQAREDARSVMTMLMSCERRLDPVFAVVLVGWQAFFVTFVIALVGHTLGFRYFGL
jgi:hypothetical protein